MYMQHRNKYILLGSVVHPNIFMSKFKIFLLDTCVEQRGFINSQTLAKKLLAESISSFLLA